MRITLEVLGSLKMPKPKRRTTEEKEREREKERRKCTTFASGTPDATQLFRKISVGSQMTHWIFPGVQYGNDISNFIHAKLQHKS